MADQQVALNRKVPDIKLLLTGDKETRLSDYAGKNIVIYFYPKASTPGCTKQACNLRDNLDGLAEHGVAVVGVSPDSNESHERFSTKHELPFPLIADPDHEIIEAYGVWGEKKNYGKTYMGLQRTTFLVDEDGMIKHVFKRPKTTAHAEEIISKLREAEIDATALQIAEIVRPKLVQDGMFLVGLDIVGDKLMEINVFSPGGLGSAQKLENVNFSVAVVEALERKVAYMGFYRRNFDNVEMATL